MNSVPQAPYSGVTISNALSEVVSGSAEIPLSDVPAIPSLLARREAFQAPARVVSIPVGTTLEQMERAYIQHVLDFNADTSNKQALTAQMLGVSQKTLYNQIKRYGLRK